MIVVNQIYTKDDAITTFPILAHGRRGAACGIALYHPGKRIDTLLLRGRKNPPPFLLLLWYSVKHHSIIYARLHNRKRQRVRVAIDNHGGSTVIRQFRIVVALCELVVPECLNVIHVATSLERSLKYGVCKLGSMCVLVTGCKKLLHWDNIYLPSEVLAHDYASPAKNTFLLVFVTGCCATMLPLSFGMGRL